MPTFGNASTARLVTCEEKLQQIMNEVIKRVDCTILCGHRNQADQEAAFAGGNSKVHFPNSRHNVLPSQAVDVAPYPIDWNDLKRFHDLSDIVKQVAAEMNIEIEWGGDWEHFKDYPHYQLKA